jgi:hypothetical protein
MTPPNTSLCPCIRLFFLGRQLGAGWLLSDVVVGWAFPETLPEQDSAVEPIDMTDETASSTEAATFDATVEATDTIPTDSTAAAVTREDDPSENELESEELATGVSTAPPKIR